MATPAGFEPATCPLGGKGLKVFLNQINILHSAWIICIWFVYKFNEKLPTIDGGLEEN